MSKIIKAIRTGTYRYQNLIPPLPRRLHTYVVGASKTGTTSLDGLFSAHYRSAHEPEHVELIDAVLAREGGAMSATQMQQLLRRRDARLRLEVDSSVLNGLVIEDLVRVFPRARYILTVRDCYSWLDSYGYHYANHSASSDWLRLRNRPSMARWTDYPEKERDLESLGVPPLDYALSNWATHNSRVLDAAPPDRLLVLRTHEISSSLERIADFLGVKAESLLASRAHSFKRQGSVRVLDRIDHAYLEGKIDKHCRALMDDLFPEFDSLEAARSITASVSA